MSRPLLIAGLVAGCVGAASLGGYFASHDAEDPGVAASSASAPRDPRTESAPATSVPPAESTEVEVEGTEPVSPTATARQEPPPAPKPRAVEPARRAPERPRAERPLPPERDPTVASRPEPTPPVVESRGETAEPAQAPAAEQPTESVPEASPAPAPPTRRDVVIEADSVLGLEVANTVSSDTAEVEDRVDARVTRDLRVDGEVVVPAGSRVQGAVTLVERGNKFKGRARLGVRFHTLVLADGTEHALQSETIYREGESVSRKTAARIGGSAVGGAILGAILGGGKGAAIGAAAGAGGGTAATMATSPEAAVLRAGSTVTVRLSGPLTVEVER
jgi:hypothetical protein